MDAEGAKRRRTTEAAAEEEDPNSVSWCFSGSLMSNLVEQFDWAATPLGPLRSWPMAWKTSLSIMLSSHFPMVLWFGEQLTVLYNDAYLPLTGNKHPTALGQPGAQVWPEIWGTIGVMLGNVWRTGKPTWATDQLLLMDRHGYTEETYWTYSYSPIRQSSGRVTGIFTAVEETTSRYVAERRLETLREVSMLASRVSSPAQFPAEVTIALSPNARDIPFALLYLAEDNLSETPKLHGQVRVLSGAPATVDEFAGPMGLQTRQVPVPPALVLTSDVSVRPDWAMVIPLLANASEGKLSPAPQDNNILGVLIIGINPHKKPDQAYFTFAKLLSSSLCAALLTAREHQRERQKAEQLAELDRAKTTFFHNVSHEFRTPLTLMLGPLEEVIASAAFAALGTQHRDALSCALRNGRRLLKLVNVLLDFARLEAGRTRAVFRPVDLAAFTADLASNFRSACDKAKLTLTVDCPPLNEPVYVDREMFEKVILNLLSNAFKFTLQGGIAVSLRRVDGAVVVRVKDSGCGIPPEELPRIFDRFHRVASAQGRTHEGTGIGLALVSELVKQHGGTVEASSVVNVGTEFKVRIPLGRAHLPPEQVVETMEVSNSTRPSSPLDWWIDTGSSESSMSVATHSTDGPHKTLGRVLAVDDNADMLSYVARILTEGGYAVTSARDGLEALNKVNEAVKAADPPFDLIVSDVMMPRMDGRGLLHAIRNSDAPIKDIPVVFLSARAGEEEIGEGVALGADDYLVKPFSGRELLTRVAARIELTRFRLSAAKREHVLREQAERASQAKDHFIAVLSHELRTPLTPALMIAEAGESDKSLPEAVRQDMRMIASNIRLEVQLIGDLLDITKIRQGKLELHVQSVEMHSLVHQTLALFSESIRNRNINVRLTLNSPATVVRGDATRLQQILWNLLGNAIKFSPPDGTISVHTEQRDGHILLAVRDNGVGIEPATISRLFSAFEQGSVTVTRQFGGLGLGLAIAKQLVLLHNGSIEAASEGLGKGATFTVRLPLAPAATTQASPSASTAAAPLATSRDDLKPMRALRILLVEDNPATQMVVAKMLQRLGQQTVTAASVSEAISLLSRERFDALLCDIGLPDGSGCEVGTYARALPSAPYAAALTGYGTDEDVQRTADSGFAMHLVKPIRLALLRDFVAAACAHAPTSPPVEAGPPH